MEPTPKPGPRPSGPIVPSAPTQHDRTAGFHAREARRLLEASTTQPDTYDEAQAIALQAIGHALTSLAFTQLSPPPRRRPRPCPTGVQVVTR